MPNNKDKVSSHQKALIIAHFNNHGALRTDTVEALPYFHNIYDRIILVSTCLSSEEVSKLPDYVEVIIRDNYGYDFYSYRQGILMLKDGGISWQVTLMNTSFIIAEPVKLCNSYLEPITSMDLFDFIGLTHSLEINEHLQSYLLTLSAALIEDSRFVDWWEKMSPLNDKNEIVTKYEVGLSQYIEELGFKLSGVLKGPMSGPYPNTSHMKFGELLNNYGVIKITLIRDNPYNLNLGLIYRRMASDNRFNNMVLEGLLN